MPSEREQIADNLADTCVFGGLNDSYGVLKSKQEKNGKKFWSVTFCKARILDGTIDVYSPTFIRIAWETAIRDLPHRGSEVFKSEGDAKSFLQRSFIRS